MQKILNEEKEFFARVNEQIQQTEKNNKIILTRFLSLREQEIINECVRYSNIKHQFFGGYDIAERKRCLFFPYDLTPSDNYFNISCFKIKYNKRYLKLSHPQVLGTLMSLSMDRSLFGDIAFDDDECYFFISSDIEQILLSEFTIINKVPISLEKIEDKIQIQEKYITKEVIISSMRIDNLISHVYNLSREKAKELIMSSYVYRNFQIVNSNASKCEVEDIISVRKHGRFTISKLLRQTKSNKLVIEIKIPTT